MSFRIRFVSAAVAALSAAALVAGAAAWSAPALAESGELSPFERELERLKQSKERARPRDKENWERAIEALKRRAERALVIDGPAASDPAPAAAPQLPGREDTPPADAGQADAPEPDAPEPDAPEPDAPQTAEREAPPVPPDARPAEAAEPEPRPAEPRPADAQPVDPRKAEADGEGLRARLEAQGYECADSVPGWSCPDLGDQIAGGSVRKGVYEQCATVSGQVDFNGSLLTDRVCGRKAALIVRDGAVIENVAVSDISLDVMAGCFRWEGGSVELRNVTCRNADMGLLGSGTRLLIEDSLFEHTHDSGTDLGHVVYTTGAELVEIVGTTMRDPGGGGHVLKTGARHTRIVGSALAGGARPYSRVIDAYNAGVLEIRDSALRMGGFGGNGDLIGYGAEMRERYSENRIVMDGGEVNCLAARARNTLHLWPDRHPEVEVDWRPAENRNCPQPVATG